MFRMLFWMVVLLFLEGTSEAVPRSRAYSGFQTVVRGDARTIGTAGSTVGVADTVLSAKDNPAGLAMGLNVGDDNFSKNSTEDLDFNERRREVGTLNLGAVLGVDRWGVGLLYIVPYREAVEMAESELGPDTHAEARIQEWRVSGARLFWGERVALGATLIVGRGTVRVEGGSPRQASQASAAALGGLLGVSFQPMKRWLLGLSFQSPFQFSTGRDPKNSFMQDIRKPWVGAAGVAWLPNRFVKLDASLFVFGPTRETALMRDEAVTVGATPRLQPSLGLSYVFVEFQNLKGSVFTGRYLEGTRLEGFQARWHSTFGIELKPWIFTLGAGLDRSVRYRSAFASVSIDAFKVLQHFSLIPSLAVEHRGLLPNPFFRSDEGLPAPLQDRRRSGAIDPLEVVKDLSERIGDLMHPSVPVPPFSEMLKKEIKDMKKAQKRRQ